MLRRTVLSAAAATVVALPAGVAHAAPGDVEACVQPGGQVPFSVSFPDIVPSTRAIVQWTPLLEDASGRVTSSLADQVTSGEIPLAPGPAPGQVSGSASIPVPPATSIRGQAIAAWGVKGQEVASDDGGLFPTTAAQFGFFQPDGFRVTTQGKVRRGRILILRAYGFKGAPVTARLVRRGKTVRSVKLSGQGDFPCGQAQGFFSSRATTGLRRGTYRVTVAPLGGKPVASTSVRIP